MTINDLNGFQGADVSVDNDGDLYIEVVGNGHDERQGAYIPWSEVRRLVDYLQKEIAKHEDRGATE